MLDTELNASEGCAKQGRMRLDVDRFFHGMALPAEAPGYLEATMVAHKEAGGLHLVFAGNRQNLNYDLMMKSSDDGGRTWGKPWHMLDVGGSPIKGFHSSVVRLPSGRLGMCYCEHGRDDGHPGRDFGSVNMWRTSEDDGHVWSDPTRIDPHFGLCCSGHAFMHSSGRLIAPAFRWISPLPGNEAESWMTSAGEACRTLSYSFMYFTDDEGETWETSRSELFVSVERAAYDLEEPTVVELADGRLLAHLRCQLGRIYRSWSDDRGVSWSAPEPLHVAAANCPQFLTRMPTGDILMVWNQVSRQEIVMGLARSRLSTAASKDEGTTWAHLKNLESLDHRSEIPPPPPDSLQVVEQFDNYGHHQPSDLERYPRAPGALRICYPNVLWRGNETIIVYDYGAGTLGDKMGVKLRAIPTEWFTS